MSKLTRLFTILLLLLFTPFVGADDDDFVILPEEKIHQGDYFASGNSIEISGVVNGDVYVFGSHIVIDGSVSGSVIALGGAIHIPGTVLGNARLCGGQVEVEGRISGNLTAFAGSFELGSQAAIEGNAVITGGHVDLLGSIGGGVNLSASNVRVFGEIGGDVNAYVGTLRIGPLAYLRGNLDYTSNSNAFIDPGAKIQGKINYQTTSVEGLIRGHRKLNLVFAGKITGILMNFFFMFVSGWLLLKISHKKLAASILALRKHPWKSLWVGGVIMILLPITCLVLFITILGFPLAIALLALSLMGFYIAKVIPILWFANGYLVKGPLKKDGLLTYALALVLFFIALRIPVVGGLLSLVITLLGLGAIFLGRLKKNSV